MADPPPSFERDVGERRPNLIFSILIAGGNQFFRIKEGDVSADNLINIISYLIINIAAIYECSGGISYRRQRLFCFSNKTSGDDRRTARGWNDSPSLPTLRRVFKMLQTRNVLRKFVRNIVCVKDTPQAIAHA